MGYKPADRRRVVRELRSIAGTIHVMVSGWNTGARVYDEVRRHEDGQKCTTGPECGVWHVFWRKREAHEFPENDRAQWLKLANDAHRMWSDLQDVESFALNRVYEIDRERGEA